MNTSKHLWCRVSSVFIEWWFGSLLTRCKQLVSIRFRIDKDVEEFSLIT